MPAAAASVGVLPPELVQQWADGVTTPSPHEATVLRLALDTVEMHDTTRQMAADLRTNLNELAAKLYSSR